MSLGGGNNFNVFSPTHDSKLVTRLQHVFHAVRAAGRPADNNRMWHISGDCQRFGNEWYLFVCLLTASRTGTCRPISMGSWPWRRSKIWIWALPCHQNHGQNDHQMANHLLIVTNMQCSLMKSFRMPFQSESTTKWILRRGVGRKKKCGQSRGVFDPGRRMQTPQRGQLQIGNRLAKHFVQWWRLKRTTARRDRATTLSSNGRNCKPEDEPNDYCRQLTSAVKKTGFKKCVNSWDPNVSHWYIYINDCI